MQNVETGKKSRAALPIETKEVIRRILVFPVQFRI